MAKRWFDVVVSFVGLIVAAPFLLGVAAAIRLVDGAPVFFRQRRLGRRGSPFILYKFRTMRSAPNGSTGSFDAGDTSRVTRLGRCLRKAKLDELPQLWNVLRGDMSLVGPRPEVERWVAVYQDRWARIHAIRPGITDPASILYRHEEEMLSLASDPEGMYQKVILPEKLALYEEYLRTRTFWGDIGILLRTVGVVLAPYHSNPIGRDEP